MDSNTPQNFFSLVNRLRLALSRFSLNLTGFTQPDCPPVLIASPGGVASTALMEHISRFVATNSPGDRDGLKHTLYPPSNAQKVILITGEPREVASSIRRRGYLGIHSAKMGSPLGVLLWGDLQQKHFEKLVRSQQVNFSTKPSGCLVLNYEEALESCEKIAVFLDLPLDDFCESFPPRRERRAM